MKELREKRLSRNWTQETVARMCGVTPVAVTQWESGVRKPNIVMLKRLAMIFGCTADDLLASIPVPDVEDVKNGNA